MDLGGRCYSFCRLFGSGDAACPLESVWKIKYKEKKVTLTIDWNKNLAQGVEIKIDAILGGNLSQFNHDVENSTQWQG